MVMYVTRLEKNPVEPAGSSTPLGVLVQNPGATGVHYVTRMGDGTRMSHVWKKIQYNRQGLVLPWEYLFITRSYQGSLCYKDGGWHH